MKIEFSKSKHVPERKRKISNNEGHVRKLSHLYAAMNLKSLNRHSRMRTMEWTYHGGKVEEVEMI